MSERLAPYNVGRENSRELIDYIHEAGTPLSNEAAVRIAEAMNDPRIAIFNHVRMAWLNLAPSLLTDDELDELRALLERLVAAGHERRAKR